GFVVGARGQRAPVEFAEEEARLRFALGPIGAALGVFAGEQRVLLARRRDEAEAAVLGGGQVADHLPALLRAPEDVDVGVAAAHPRHPDSGERAGPGRQRAVVFLREADLAERLVEALAVAGRS